MAFCHHAAIAGRAFSQSEDGPGLIPTTEALSLVNVTCWRRKARMWPCLRRPEPGDCRPSETPNPVALRRQAQADVIPDLWLDFAGDPRALVDGAFGVQFGSDIGTSNHVHLHAGRNQFIGQLSVGLLASADHHMVDRQDV